MLISTMRVICPIFRKKGFEGNIFATFATRDLCAIMLPDSARIQTSDAKWMNKHRKKKDLPPIEPLYNEIDAEKCLRQFVNLGYNRPMLIANGVKLTFLDAGHILGSAQVLLEVEDEEDGKTKRFLFSGDVGRGDNDILRDPVAGTGYRLHVDGEHLRRTRARVGDRGR